MGINNANIGYNRKVWDTSSGHDGLWVLYMGPKQMDSWKPNGGTR